VCERRAVAEVTCGAGGSRGRIVDLGPRERAHVAVCIAADHEDTVLRFHRELHRQLLEHLLAEAVDDHRHRVLGGRCRAAAVEQLVLADLRGGGLVLDLAPGFLTSMYGKVCAPQRLPISSESHCV
jgi:hypothetical protein